MQTSNASKKQIWLIEFSQWTPDPGQEDFVATQVQQSLRCQQGLQDQHNVGGRGGNRLLNDLKFAMPSEPVEPTSCSKNKACDAHRCGDVNKAWDVNRTCDASNTRGGTKAP